MNNLVDYAIVAGVGALITALLLRPARLISIQLDYQAMPDERKVHESPTPLRRGSSDDDWTLCGDGGGLCHSSAA